VKYVGETIEKLRRYIAEKDCRHVLEEVDKLLFVALEDVQPEMVKEMARRR
jgi:hypothetical protein